MIPGPVGFQCPECVRAGVKNMRQAELPYGGKRSGDPRITSIVLIAINVLVWIGIMLTSGWNGWLAKTIALIPVGMCDTGDGLHIALTDHVGCMTSSIAGYSWVPGVGSGAWWQLITSAFAHVEVWHIGFNMLALWMLGPLIEKLLGRSRFLAIYFIAALAGSGVAVLFSPTFGMTLGASGAIFGLMGAVLLIAIKHQGNVRSILIWLGLNVAITVTNLGQISWEGHLGGFLGGLAATAAVIHLPKDKRSWQWPLLILLGLGSIALSVITALQR